MTARRIVLSGPRQISIQPFEPTNELAFGEARLRVSHSLISPGTELSVIAAAKEGHVRGLGYTAVGTIEADGGGIDQSLRDRPVFLFPAFPDQMECHASHKVCKRDAIFMPVPDGLAPAKACFARMINVVLTPFAHIESRIHGTALVMGLGLVGNLAAQVAGLRGFEVIGVDPDPARRERARQVGVRHLIDPATGDVVQQVKALTGGLGAMLSINATGAAATFMTSIEATASGGEFSSLGGARGDTMVNLVDLYHHIQWRHVTLRGAWEMHLPRRPVPTNRLPSTEEHLALALRWLRDDTIKMESLWTHTIKPDEAPGAYAALTRADPAYLGVVIDWR